MCCQKKHCEKNHRLVDINDHTLVLFFSIIFVRILTCILLYMINQALWGMENSANFLSFAASLTLFKLLCDIIFLSFCFSQDKLVIFNNQIRAIYHKIILGGSVLTILFSVVILGIVLNASVYTSDSMQHNFLTIGGMISILLCCIDLILIGLTFYFKQPLILPDNDQYNELSDNIV
jgi:hypothetical protein